MMKLNFMLEMDTIVSSDFIFFFVFVLFYAMFIFLLRQDLILNKLIICLFNFKINNSSEFFSIQTSPAN
jgi:hypothetical protein